MGWAIVWGACASCKTMFSFNPHKVPSVRINGVREPVCRSCIERVNPVRIKNGLAPITIDPEAYEPIEEGSCS